MEGNSIPQRRWLNWSLITAGWTFFGLFFASEAVVSRAYAGRPLMLRDTLIAWFICAYLWLALTPPVIFLSRRFALGRARWLKSFLVQLATSVAFALFRLAIYVTIASWVGLSASGSFLEAFRNQFITGFHFALLS